MNSCLWARSESDSFRILILFAGAECMPNRENFLKNYGLGMILKTSDGKAEGLEIRGV